MPTDPPPADLQDRVRVDRYPRSGEYDARWQLESAMGPNVLWLAEAVTGVLPLEAGMRVLDLGCGKAASSVFLAREFGVTVWAADLWIDPGDNWERIVAAGGQDRVFPLRIEAHDLPFAAAYFDVVIGLDSYHYFGTDDLYLPYLARFVAPRGRLGIVVPGVRAELGGTVPEHLRPYWEPEMWTFHSPAWWRAHVEKSEAMAVERADWVADWDLWAEWTDLCIAAGTAPMPEAAVREAEMLRGDAGRTLGFTRLVARKPADG